MLNKEMNHLIEKWAEDIEIGTSPKTQMENKPLKRYSTSSISREIQMKYQKDTTIHTEWLKSRGQTTPNAKQGCGAMEILLCCCSNAKWYSHFLGLL